MRALFEHDEHFYKEVPLSAFYPSFKDAIHYVTHERLNHPCRWCRSPALSTVEEESVQEIEDEQKQEKKDV